MGNAVPESESEFVIVQICRVLFLHAAVTLAIESFVFKINEMMSICRR